MASDAVLAQIEGLAFNGRRPLVICDVDEVVVHFTRAFETFLAGRGHYLDPASLALDGNIKCLADHTPAPRETVGELVQCFFAAHTRDLEPIEGAVGALIEIGRQADVVMLSNLPADAAEDRRINLKRLGLDYPLVVNSGPKGPAVKSLAGRVDGLAIFIDDSPNFIASARQHAPDVHLIHFMHDERFARFSAPFDYLSLRTGHWSEARPHMLELIANPSPVRRLANAGKDARAARVRTHRSA